MERKTRLVFIGGTSRKYWEIYQISNTITTHWGRLGHDGVCKTLTFSSESAAKCQFAQLVASKLRKGYRA